MKGFAKPDLKTLSPGTLVAERYSIVEVLGHGGMGVVYKACDVQLDRIVALKMVLQTTMAEDQRRFEREAHAASLLDHPNVITIYDFGLDNHLPYLSMEYLEGRNLDEVIEKKPLTINQFRHIFAQACSGLQLAHEKGIVHRDLKPGNLMIVERGSDKESVIVLDFGLVKLMDDASGPDQKITKLTRTNMLLGSPLYMSPEQCRSLAVDHRSDIYSLGCVMYEALTGSPPIVADTLFDVMNKHISETPRTMREVRPGLYVPPPLERLIFNAMAKSPDDRPQSMAEVARLIESSFSGAPDVILASQPKVVKTSLAGDGPSAHNKPASTRKRRQQTLSWLGIGIGILLCFLTVGVLLRSSTHRELPASARERAVSAESDRAPLALDESPTANASPSSQQPAPARPTLTLQNPAATKATDKAPPFSSAVLSPTVIQSPQRSPLPAAVPYPEENPSVATVKPVATSPPAIANPPAATATIAASTSTIASSTLGGGSQSSLSPEKLLIEANFSFKRNDWSQARTQFESLLDKENSSDQQTQTIGKLVVCAFKMHDTTAASEYLSRFKDRFTFYTINSGDSQWLMQIYDISKALSDKEDYSFSEKIIRASIDDFSHQNLRPNKDLFRMKLELNHIYASQNRTADCEQLLEELIRESDEVPDVNNEAKDHLARIQARAGRVSMPPPPMGDPRRGGPEMDPRFGPGADGRFRAGQGPP